VKKSDRHRANLGFTGMGHDFRCWREIVTILEKYDRVLRVSENNDDLILVDTHTKEELKEYIAKMEEREK